MICATLLWISFIIIYLTTGLIIEYNIDKKKILDLEEAE